MTAINPSHQSLVNGGSARRVMAGSGTRTVLVVLGSVFTIIALAVGLFRLLAVIAYDQHDEVATFSAGDLRAVEVVSIDNSAGRIHVAGTTTPGARVELDVGDGLFRARHREAIQGDVLAVEASCPLSFATRCHVNHQLEVPAGLGLDVRSRMGDVTLTGTEGEVSVDAAFGHLSIADAAGPLALDHRFGGVDARGLVSPRVDTNTHFGDTNLAFTSAPDDLRVSSRFGSVVIELPDDGAAYRLTGSSDMGNRSVTVRTDPTSSRVIHLDTAFGDVTIRYTR